MAELTTAQMVELWERGKALPEWKRALETLSIADSAADPVALRKLNLGNRNARLFAIRQNTFGEVMRAFVKCPNCSEPLEFEQPIGELLADNPAIENGRFEFEADGISLQGRLHSSADLAATEHLLFEDEIREAMTDRLLVHARTGSEELPAAGLSEETRAALREEAERLDPLANPRIPLGCAACEHVWRAPIDIGAYLWVEIERQVRLVLDDVIALARGYGWREDDILEMSASRRQLYLEALD